MWRVSWTRGELFAMPYILITTLIVALVWILATTLGLPYLVSIVVTLLAALYLFGPGRSAIGRPPRRSR
jgi:ABC-type xylose transport system permease subunit